MATTFEVTTNAQATTIQCPPVLDQKAATEFIALVQPWLDKPEKIYILEMADVTSLDFSSFSRTVVVFHQALKKRGACLFSTHVNEAIASQIKVNGLESIFSMKENIVAVLDSAGVKITRPKMDLEFIQPFIKATVVTLETQANTKVKIGKPKLKEEKDAFKADIAGVLSLVSPAFQGSIAVCFPAIVFLTIYSNMVGEKHESINKEIEDAAGEILNIIFGQAKVVLNDKAGYQIQKAIPTIINGNNLQVHHLTRQMAMVVPFETAAGPFQVEISTDAE